MFVTLTALVAVSLGDDRCDGGCESERVCLNDGVGHCDCDKGWCGETCEYPCNVCPTKQDGIDPSPNEVLYNGKMVEIPYCVHGECIYTQKDGPSCNCTGTGWKDEHCHTPIGDLSHRCIAYDTDTTIAAQEGKPGYNPAIEQHVCNLTIERCIPDNMDCMFNIGIKYVDGKPVCVPPAPRKQCQCQYPIGWCIPLEPGNNVMKSVAAALNQYINPSVFQAL